MTWIRQGSCNRCGQCCGADGSPNQLSPWPKNWPEAIRNWQYTDFATVMGQAGVVGLQANIQNGTVEKVEDYGQFNIKGKKIQWRWVPNNGLCKNLTPPEDPDTWSHECPMLLPDPGDGSRPCALVNTKHEWMYTASCFPEGPLQFRTAAEVDQWTTDHPLCSHSWIEE